jgi:flagellar FliJ protein
VKNRFPLQTLLDLSHARMDDAARRLGQLIASEQEGSRQLAMLIEYREEYHRRFLEAARLGMDRDLWENYRSFLARLDEAIAQQQTVLDASRQRKSVGQQTWMEKRSRAKAFDTLSARHKAGVLREEGRAEQKITDEHAAKGSRAEEPPE